MQRSGPGLCAVSNTDEGPERRESTRWVHQGLVLRKQNALPDQSQVLLQHGADLVAKNLRAGVEGSIPCPGGSTPLHLAGEAGTSYEPFHEKAVRPLRLPSFSTAWELRWAPIAALGGQQGERAISAF